MSEHGKNLEGKSAIINSIRSGATFISSLIFALIMFRFSSPEEIGSYYFFLSITVLGSFLFNIPLSSLYYVVPKRGKSANSLIVSSLLLAFPIAFLLYASILSLLGFDSPVKYGIMAAMISTLNHISPLLFSSFRLKESLWATLMGNAAKIIGTTYFALQGNLGSFELALSTTAMAVVPSVFLIQKEGLAISFGEVIKKMRNHIGGGFLFYLTQFLNNILLWIDSAFLGLFFTFQDVGIYNAVSNVMKYVLISIPYSISFFIVPLVIKGSSKRLMQRAAFIMTLMLGPLIISTIYPQPFIVAITGSYLDFAYLAYFFIPAGIVLPLQALYTQYLMSKKDVLVLKTMLAAALLNLFLNYFFSFQLGMGIDGVALASGLSGAIYTVMLAYFSKLRIGSKKILFHMVVLSLFLAVLSSLLPKDPSNSIEGAILGTLAMAAAFAINIILLYIMFRKELLESVGILLEGLHITS